jgi:hypothetical protein
LSILFGTPTSPGALPLFSILIVCLTYLGKVRAKDQRWTCFRAKQNSSPRKQRSREIRPCSHEPERIFQQLHSPFFSMLAHCSTCSWLFQILQSLRFDKPNPFYCSKNSITNPLCSKIPLNTSRSPFHVFKVKDWRLQNNFHYIV